MISRIASLPLRLSHPPAGLICTAEISRRRLRGHPQATTGIAPETT